MNNTLNLSNLSSRKKSIATTFGTEKKRLHFLFAFLLGVIQERQMDIKKKEGRKGQRDRENHLLEITQYTDINPKITLDFGLLILQPYC